MVLKCLKSTTPRSHPNLMDQIIHRKAKMTTYIKSINRNVWKVVETKFEVADLENPTTAEEMLL
jgi:hypothetical protein